MVEPRPTTYLSVCLETGGQSISVGELLAIARFPAFADKEKKGRFIKKEGRGPEEGASAMRNAVANPIPSRCIPSDAPFVYSDFLSGNGIEMPSFLLALQGRPRRCAVATRRPVARRGPRRVRRDPAAGRARSWRGCATSGTRGCRPRPSTLSEEVSDRVTTRVTTEGVKGDGDLHTPK